MKRIEKQNSSNYHNDNDNIRRIKRLARIKLNNKNKGKTPKQLIPKVEYGSLEHKTGNFSPPYYDPFELHIHIWRHGCIPSVENGRKRFFNKKRKEFSGRYCVVCHNIDDSNQISNIESKDVLPDDILDLNEAMLSYNYDDESNLLNSEGKKSIDSNPFQDLDDIIFDLESLIIEPDDKCSICHNDIFYMDKITTDCKHKFHKKCLKEWIEKSTCKSCPLCRVDLSKNSIFISSDENLFIKNTFCNFSYQNKNMNGKIINISDKSSYSEYRIIKIEDSEGNVYDINSFYVFPVYKKYNKKINRYETPPNYVSKIKYSNYKINTDFQYWNQIWINYLKWKSLQESLKHELTPKHYVSFLSDEICNNAKQLKINNDKILNKRKRDELNEFLNTKRIKKLFIAKETKITDEVHWKVIKTPNDIEKAIYGIKSLKIS